MGGASGLAKESQDGLQDGLEEQQEWLEELQD